jgi:hypothetical protein
MLTLVLMTLWPSEATKGLEHATKKLENLSLRCVIRVTTSAHISSHYISKCVHCKCYRTHHLKANAYIATATLTMCCISESFYSNCWISHGYINTCS